MEGSSMGIFLLSIAVRLTSMERVPVTYAIETIPPFLRSHEPAEPDGTLFLTLALRFDCTAEVRVRALPLNDFMSIAPSYPACRRC